MEEPNFRLYDLVVCTESGEVGVIGEVGNRTAVIDFPSGIRIVEYLDIEILDRNATLSIGFRDAMQAFRRS